MQSNESGEVLGVRRRQVLAVDDEPGVLVALEDVLSDDFEVLKATSAEQVFNLLQAESDIAVVISDQRMPGMSGDELLRRLTLMCDATRMLVTGYADLAAVIRAVNNGRIFAYVTKPWDREELRTTVHKCAQHFDLLRDLERERQLLEDLMNSIPDAIYFKDTDRRLTRVNRAFGAFSNLGTPAQAVGKRVSDLGMTSPITSTAYQSAEREVLAEGRVVVDFTSQVEAVDGRRFFSTTVAPVRARSGAVVGLVGVSRDVTARAETERALRRTTRVRTMLGAVNAAIVRVKDADALFRECCRIAVHDGGLLGAALLSNKGEDGKFSVVGRHAEGDELTRRLLEAALDARDDDPWNPLVALELGRPVVVHLSAADTNAVFPAELTSGEGLTLGMFPLVCETEVVGALALASAEPDLFAGEEGRLLADLAHNVAFAVDHLEKRQRLEFLACYDELTGLPRRELVLDRLQQLLAKRLGTRGGLAVVVLDVSRFRQVNDTLGREAGDEVLVQLAERLATILAPGDTLGRSESDSFCLVLAGPADEATLTPWIDHCLLPALSAPFTVHGTELRITGRLGIATFPLDATDGENLLRNAEAALANARARGARCLYYAPSMNARVGERLTLETRLRRALEERQFTLHYQPKLDLKSGAVVGLEALIRWADPERGLVPPAEFIPVLEETGLIIDVGAWVLNTAAAQFTAWQQARLSPPPIAVNVSALQLAERGFVRSVEHALREHPLAREHFDLEITESVFMQDFAQNVEKLQALRSQGVRVAIDDFGTGYSSLGYLSRLPIDALKIDRSFVHRMADDPQDMAIVTTIISLAHSLNLEVIAEGVETAEQAQILKLVSCDQIQGYLIGKPLTADDVTAQFGRVWRG